MFQPEHQGGGGVVTPGGLSKDSKRVPSVWLFDLNKAERTYVWIIM